jgi:bacterioferritin (cytochrome b1)
MQEFIAHENIKRFKKALADTPDEIKKATLRQLLADEEAHLKKLEAHHPI